MIWRSKRMNKDEKTLLVQVLEQKWVIASRKAADLKS